MKKRTALLAATTLCVTLTCGIQPTLAATGQPLPVTKEQQAALQRYRSQQEILQQKEQQIKALMQALKQESKQLRTFVAKKNNSALEKQVKTDLRPFHDKLKRAYQVHKSCEELNKKIHAARMKKDLAQMRTLTEQLVEGKKSQLALLQSARQDLLVELKKVRGK